MKPPASPRTPIDITIDTLGGLGDGMIMHDGKPLFVPKSCAGDKLRVTVVHENHDGRYAMIDHILHPGPDRVDAPCAHYQECGGCTLQHLSDDAYRRFKTNLLHAALRRAGYDRTDAQVTFLPHASRRRVEFKVQRDAHGVRLALLPLRSHIPMAIDHCAVLDPHLQAMIAPLNEALSSLPWAQHIKSVSITLADNGIDMAIRICDSHSFSPPAADALLNGTGVSRLNVRDMNTMIYTSQRQPVTMSLGGYAVDLPPGAFLQATAQGQQLLTEFALNAVKNAGQVADLFCGIGTYSFPASRTAHVHAVELDTGMITNLRRTARHYHIHGLTGETRDLFKNPLNAKALTRFDAAIINPPRLGAKAQIEQLAQAQLPIIAMISCNPATFARDAQILTRAGYRMIQAVGIDQFVWNAHLEIAAVFIQ